MTKTPTLRVYAGSEEEEEEEQIMHYLRSETRKREQTKEQRLPELFRCLIEYVTE